MSLQTPVSTSPPTSPAFCPPSILGQCLFTVFLLLERSLHSSDCVTTHGALTRATPEHCGAAPAELKFLGSLQVPCCFPDTVMGPMCVHQRLACLRPHRTCARLTCRDSTVRWGQEGSLRTLRGVLHPSCLRVPRHRMSGCCASVLPILFLKTYVSIAPWVWAVGVAPAYFYGAAGCSLLACVQCSGCTALSPHRRCQLRGFCLSACCVAFTLDSLWLVC